MPDDDTTRANCDAAIMAAARIMLGDVGATGEMMLDRMLTFSAAQAVGWSGPAATAAAFRLMADRIDAGVFAAIEAKKDTRRH